VLKEAYLTDSREALDNLKKKNKKGRRFIIKEINEGLRTVVACFLVCLLVAGGLLAAVKFRVGSFGDISYTTPGNNLTSPSTSTVWDSKVDAETILPETDDMRDVYAFEVGALDYARMVEYSRSRSINSGYLFMSSVRYLLVVKVDSVADVKELSDIVADRNKGDEKIFSHMDEEYFEKYVFYFIYLPTSNTGGEYILKIKTYKDHAVTALNVKCIEEGDAEAESGWFFGVAYTKEFNSEYPVNTALYGDFVSPVINGSDISLGFRDICISEIGRTSLFSENETLKELVVNKDKLDITTEMHKRVYKITSVSDCNIVLNDLIERDEGYIPYRGEYEPMRDVLGCIKDSYFNKYTLYMIYLPTPIGGGIYSIDRITLADNELCIYIKDETFGGTTTTSGWLFTVAVPKSLSDTFTSVDCIYFKSYDNK